MSLLSKINFFSFSFPEHIKDKLKEREREKERVREREKKKEREKDKEQAKDKEKEKKKHKLMNEIKRENGEVKPPQKGELQKSERSYSRGQKFTYTGLKIFNLGILTQVNYGV